MVREHESARRDDTTAPQSLRRGDDDLALAPSVDGAPIRVDRAGVVAGRALLDRAIEPRSSTDGASDLDQPYDRVRDYAPATRPRSGCVIEQLRIDLRERGDDEARAALRFVELAERESPHECKARR